jgi:SAM-dependent methyltransferase
VIADSAQDLGLTQLLRELTEDVPGVIEQVSPQDQMHETNPSYYFEAAQRALRCVRLAMLSAGKPGAGAILDLPCGHGRVLRALKAAFPQASLTACDINRDGVDFCAEVLGAKPVYSAPHPRDVELGRTFDLIWVGSLLTHLDLEGTRAFLDLFESVLEPGGVLVFTTHGRMVADRLRAGLATEGMKAREVRERYGVTRPHLTWAMNEQQLVTILDGYDRDGFGYDDWFTGEERDRLSMPLNYGISIANPSWTCAELARRDSLRLVLYKEAGWGPALNWWSQDVVGCVKLDG